MSIGGAGVAVVGGTAGAGWELGWDDRGRMGRMADGG